MRKMTRNELRDKLNSELEEVKDKYNTDYRNNDLYWRGVRIGLETALANLDFKVSD